MASIKEVEDWISRGTYPHVARTSDPLIVRVSRFSLLVNDTNFYAKIKNGLGYKGYLIYSSGLGTPILEESATNETEFFSNDVFKKAISDNGTDTGNKFYESAERVQTVLQDAAQSWLDTIELEIAKQPNDNAIKKAIDRLCWQLHYDITQSSTDFPEVFKDNDFGDVQIDWDKNDTWNGKTVNESVFDNYTAISTSVTDGSSTISGGSSLQGVKSSINSFDGNLCGKFETFNGKFDTFNNNFTTFDTHLNGSIDSTRLDIKNSLNTIGTKLVPDGGNYYSISECLRDAKNGGTEQAYSVAKSLREIGQTSVSQATHDQTDLESTHFTDIEGRIGDTSFGEGAVSLVQRIGIFNCGDTRRSLFDTFGGDDGYANKANNALSNSVGYLSGTGLEGRLGVTSTNTRSIAERLGYDSSGSVSDVLGDNTNVGTSTVAGLTRSVYNLMSPSAYGGSGFVALQDNKAYVRTSAW